MSAQTRRHGCGRVGFESSEFRAFDLREKRQEGLVSAIWATGDRVRPEDLADGGHCPEWSGGRADLQQKLKRPRQMPYVTKQVEVQVMSRKQCK